MLFVPESVFVPPMLTTLLVPTIEHASVFVPAVNSTSVLLIVPFVAKQPPIVKMLWTCVVPPRFNVLSLVSVVVFVMLPSVPLLVTINVAPLSNVLPV